MRVAIAGSHGYLGSRLFKNLENRGTIVTRLVRDNPVDDELVIDNDLSLEGFDAVVNLAGHPIGARRLDNREKTKIITSRMRTTGLVARAIARANVKPALINASAIGYYGPGREEELVEDSLPGTGFLSTVVRAWEHATLPASESGARVVNLRTGIVLGRGGGIMARLYPLFKFGLGGKLASGNQIMSWISLQDHLAAMEYCIDSKISGPVNLVAPNPVTNAELTKELGHALHRPTIFHVPKFAIAAVFGTELADNFASSLDVKPAKLQQSGFDFKHATLAEAMPDILSK